MPVLFIDNFDSFAHNLARYFRLIGQETLVFRNDAISLAEIRGLRPDAIVLSPGPKSPSEAGICIELIQHFSGVIPILGVCLGHQCIAAAFGAEIVRVPPVHGRHSEIRHNESGLFAALPNPMRVARYHSLAVARASMPESLSMTAESSEGHVMAIQHREHVTCGVQFHPESVLTEHGIALLRNFLNLAGIGKSDQVGDAERGSIAWNDSDSGVTS